MTPTTAFQNRTKTTRPFVVMTDAGGFYPLVRDYPDDSHFYTVGEMDGQVHSLYTAYGVWRLLEEGIEVLWIAASPWEMPMSTAQINAALMVDEDYWCWFETVSDDGPEYDDWLDFATDRQLIIEQHNYDVGRR